MLPQTELELTSPTAQAFLRRHFPQSEVRQVPMSGEMSSGYCYSNVRSMVDVNGGRAQCGWTLSLLPGRFVEALHHVVWERPDGELVDITAAAYPAMIKPLTDFILDSTINLGPLDPCVPSIFHQIDRSDGTKEYIDLTKKRMVLRGKANAMVWRGKAFGAPYERINAELAQVEYRRDLYLARMNAGDFTRMGS